MSERLSDQATPRALRPAKRERSDVGFRAILGLLALILSVLLLMLAVAYWIYPSEVQDRRFTLPFPDFPAPRLQASPPVDMDVFRAEQMRQLNSAGWQDKTAGRVHIPIDQAMALVAKDGIAGWPTAPGPARR